MQDKNFVFTTPLQSSNHQQLQTPLIQTDTTNAQNGGHVIVGTNLQNDFTPLAQAPGANIGFITPLHVANGGTLLINQPVAEVFFTPNTHPNLQIAPNAPLRSQANQIVFTTPQHVANGGTLFIDPLTDLDLSSISYNSENDSSDNSVSGSEYAMFSNLDRVLHHHQLTSFNEAMLDEGFRVGDSDSNPETSRSSDGLTSSIGTKRSHDEIGSDDSDDSIYDIFDSTFESTESYTSAAIPVTPINLTPNVGIALGTIDRTAMQAAVTPITPNQLAIIFEGVEEGADDESVENEGSSDYQDGEIIATSNPDQDLAGEFLDYDLGFNFNAI